MKRILLILAALLLLWTSAFAEAVRTPAGADPQLTLQDIRVLNGGTARICSDGGKVTFVAGRCTDAPIRGPEDAGAVVASMTGLLGSGAGTRFEPWNTLRDPFSNTYYVFQQVHADAIVQGGAVKVIADGNGTMLGLTGCVADNLPDAAGAEGLTAAEAEALVLRHEAGAGRETAVPLAGMTRKIVLPVERELDLDADCIDYRFVWAVYTANPSGSVSGAELPYQAHYVSLAGEYLYSLPTILPGDTAGNAGYSADYVFAFMEPAEYTGYVDLSDGTEQEISVTLMRDTRTGMYYLGNIEHRIVVADCWDFLYNHGRVTLEYSPDNLEWDQTSLLSLYNYCRADDHYRAIGWQSDGRETPIIILKDFCDAEHRPVNNAAYAGHFYGWQCFLSSSVNDLAQCLDVCAHEYTHCVTESLLPGSVYLNDAGAINEALSDIQGNLCEMMAGATEDQAWTIGENGAAPIRSMSDPRRFHQPVCTWDLHYQDIVGTPTEANDYGGVHANSSLLNLVAYKLCAEGGMKPEDARAYWFAVDCAMTSGTDYPQLRELLPWVMKICGLDACQDTLARAIAETRLGEKAVPGTLAEDQALLVLPLPDSEIFRDGKWRMSVLSVNTEKLQEKIGLFSDGLRNHDFSGFPKLIRQFMAEAEEKGLWRFLLESLSGLMADGAADRLFDEADVLELSKWLQQQVSDVFGMCDGAAGQDGRTIRMMSRPGRTVPALTYISVMPNSDTIQQMNLVVWLNHHWADVTWLLDGRQEAEESKDFFDSPLFADLMQIVLTCGNGGDFLDALTLDVKGGAVFEIPSDGLEKIDLSGNMAGTMDQEVPAANNRPSQAAGERQLSLPDRPPEERRKYRPAALFSVRRQAQSGYFRKCAARRLRKRPICAKIQ